MGYNTVLEIIINKTATDHSKGINWCNVWNFVNQTRDFKYLTWQGFINKLCHKTFSDVTEHYDF